MESSALGDSVQVQLSFGCITQMLIHLNCVFCDFTQIRISYGDLRLISVSWTFASFQNDISFICDVFIDPASQRLLIDAYRIKRSKKSNNV